jgi:TorA maturation chaperone TorD
LDLLPSRFWSEPGLDLGTFLRELTALSYLPLVRLQGEHTRLFINGYPHVACPPYESVYTEGELMGEAAQEVGALYGRWGVEVPADQVDHAGAELEFVAFLLSLGTPEALADADRFLAEHMLSWLPRFAADLVGESRLGFYRALGRLLAAAVEEGSGVA